MEFTQSFNNTGKMTKKDLDREMVKFTLSLYNNPHLSRKGVDDVLKIFMNFVSELFVPFIQNQMETELKPLGHEPSYFKAKFIMEKNKNLFQKFSTEHSRLKIYEQESLYIPPQLFEIGEEPIFVIVDCESIKVEMQSRYAAYVPLEDTLKTALAVPGLFNEMRNYVNDL